MRLLRGERRLRISAGPRTDPFAGGGVPVEGGAGDHTDHLRRDHRRDEEDEPGHTDDVGRDAVSAQMTQSAPLFPDLPPSLVVGFVVTDALMALFGAFFLLFSVAFYRTLDGAAEGEDAPSTPGTVA